MNFEFIHAQNGQEAIEFCKTNPNISLILMDIKMPITDGYTAAKRIKEFRPDLPIIAQSAYALIPEREKYIGTEFDDYITKPINEKELIQKIMNNIPKDN
jgi:CheY-like chemotaxis protein